MEALGNFFDTLGSEGGRARGRVRGRESEREGG